MEKFNKIKFGSKETSKETAAFKSYGKVYKTRIAVSDYGNLVRGREYKVIRKGYDFFLIKLKGRLFYAPNWVFE